MASSPFLWEAQVTTKVYFSCHIAHIEKVGDMYSFFVKNGMFRNEYPEKEEQKWERKKETGPTTKVYIS